jgi:hypothetical protein
VTRGALASLVLVAGCGGASATGGTTPVEVELEARPLVWGETQAALADCDATDASGRHVHAYAVELAAGERARLSLHADWDPLLSVRGPGEFRAENDDAFPGNTDSLLIFTAPASGTYEVRAAALRPGVTGAYRLHAAKTAREGDGTALPLDAPTAGTLGTAAPGQIGGAWFRFEARQGSAVRLRVTSTDFDTVATVLGPDGQSWINDDANDLGADRSERPLDSTLVVAAPRTGIYQLVVTSYGGNGTGAFRVTPSVRAPVVLAENVAALSDGYAGPDGRGRVIGVFTGITAYTESSELYGCADDARFLAEAFRAARLMEPAHQQVLTDGQATRAAFLGAIARMAAEARPEDLAIVFYSGHGNVQPAPPGNTTELDGVDETMQLIDERLTDDEVVAALAQVRAGTIILAMDSCHSGGFADDFVTAPGRIGLFSSDPDVLSDTAEPRRAGGYLSHWLRQGVLGHADVRPRDGFLHAGELADFVYDGFVQDHRRMNPEGGVAPMQRLVVARGSVPYVQPLWTYPRRPDLELYPLPTHPLVSVAPEGQPAVGAPATESRCE